MSRSSLVALDGVDHIFLPEESNPRTAEGCLGGGR